ncbi:nucleotidyltransferase family protein [Thiococcus pfennigii]|uniref:nucleotidyltransferase family protein n=1 Tax=Thiococcus pfennigii TaxID=1057 RepID=UPI0019078D43|nr:nucleotidyltransferase family protein [Thiococcus pfennigii]MBK1732272.1 DNA polymerase subunit beta [Thiococcus pfennigii]
MPERRSSRDSILEQLRRLRPELTDRFAVERIALFGSAARDMLRDDSDIDLLVTFRGRATLDGYFGLKGYLEQALGQPVDLVTERGLKPLARASVEQDLIRVP